MATSTAVKERPILFSGPMVRAILDGRKTQTRRVAFPRHWHPRKATFHPGGFPRIANGEWGIYLSRPHAGPYLHIGPCPYGVPGDRLWVRETHSIMTGERDHTGRDPDTVFYRADQSSATFDYYSHEPIEASDFCDLAMVDIFGGGWKPSIHMPRWASRITLEITDVRVERVQAISSDDCLAEGVVGTEEWTKCRGETLDGGDPSDPNGSIDRGWEQYTREIFRDLWNDLNAKRGYGWDKNPWVWAITFRRL